MLTETKPIVVTQTRVDLHCHCGEKWQLVYGQFIKAVCQNGHIEYWPKNSWRKIGQPHNQKWLHPAKTDREKYVQDEAYWNGDLPYPAVGM